ncbi:transposable element Tcb2 transposase [Trichonephila clavipes]|nr:transposable element Tcb2 transposase [Trichonephila clavipes]
MSTSSTAASISETRTPIPTSIAVPPLIVSRDQSSSSTRATNKDDRHSVTALFSMSTMSQRSHLTDSEACRVNRFLETGSAGRRPGQHRRRATTPYEDRYLVLTAQRHRNMNATLLQQNLRSATGTTVSTQTVRNRLHGVRLYAH